MLKDFEIPTNVKQIGVISDGLNIYVEDYVITYLQNNTAAANGDERLSVLVGQQMEIDGKKTLFINGAIRGRYCLREGDIKVFSDESWSYVDTQIKKHFKGMEVLGWALSQPGYGLYISSEYEEYHSIVFDSDEQVLFVNDPDENINAFYTYNVKTKHLQEASGYFIYFDKNPGMQEYILENKIATDKAEEAVSETKKNTASKTSRLDKNNEKEIELIYQTPKKTISGKTSNDDSEKPTDQKKLMNTLVGVSCILVAVTIIMGASVMKSDNRIGDLEAQVGELTNSYTQLESTLEDTVSTFSTPSDETSLPNTVDTSDSTSDTQTSVDASSADSTSVTQNDASNASALPATESPTPEASKENSSPEKTPTVVVTPGPDSTSSEISSKDIPDTYTVQSGDNLYYISEKFYGDDSMVSEIMKDNDISDPNKIYYGMVLELPS